MRRRDYDPDIFNAVNPVVACKFYRHGCVEVVRESLLKYKQPHETREKVQDFSDASRTRLAFVAKETDVQFLTMFTLTYGPTFPSDGLVVKRHLHKMLGRMVSTWGRFDYLWFYEFQVRGAPHIHVMSNLDEPSKGDRNHFARLWADDVLDLNDWPYSRLRDGYRLAERAGVLRVHKRPEQWEKIRFPDGAARYCTKYALKTDQKTPPKWFRNCGRFWGHTRRVGKLKYDKVLTTEADIRVWLEKKRPDINKNKVLPKLIFDCFT